MEEQHLVFHRPFICNFADPVGGGSPVCNVRLSARNRKAVVICLLLVVVVVSSYVSNITFSHFGMAKGIL